MKTLIILASILCISAASAQQAQESFLTWNVSPAIEQVTQYRVYERTGAPADFTYTLRINVTEPEVSLKNIPGLSSGTRTYVITAVNVFGESPYSDPITIPVAPTKPGNVRLQVIVVPSP